MDESLTHPWRRLPADLSPAVAAHLDQITQAVIVAVTEGTPAFAGIEDGKFRRDVRTAVQTALERLVELVGTDEPALPPHLRDVFVGLGAGEAREGRGPEVLLAALRTASRLTLRMTSGALARVRRVDTAELLDLADAISAYVDELAAASTDGFALQVREQAGEGDRRRRHLGELLLRGSASQSVVDAAAAAIGWRPPGTIVPVLLPLDQAREARFRYAADGVVVERGRDAVLLLRAGPRTGRRQLTDVLCGWGAVVGPALGWPQVPEGVRLTELAAERAGPPGAAGVADPTREPVFVDDLLADLGLAGEPGAFAVLAARRLAPLASLRDVQRERLLQTLRCWLLHWGSRAEVSAELFVHPQTVSYRLGQLRDLLGEDLDDPVARFELLLVLEFRRPVEAVTS
ncbi:MAG TPA: helix-turn-helix domain-containing protein [Kineosporiaceae bacterium]